MNFFVHASRLLRVACLLSFLSLVPALASAAGWQDVRSTVAMRGLATDGSTYVAAGSNGIWTSTDLVNWTKAALPAGAGILYNDVLWDGSRFIAVGMGVINSQDGVTWSLRVKPTSTRFFWNSIVLSGGIYVVVGNDATDVLRSTDGVHWSAEPTGFSNTSTGGFSLTGVASDGTGFVASGNKYTDLGFAISADNDIMITSPDGVTWTQQTLPSNGDDLFDQSLLNDVAFGAGLYVAGGVGGVYTSPDGITWTSVPLDLGSDFPIMTRIRFVNGEFVASGRNDGSDGQLSSVFTSSDGIHWATHKLEPRGASTFSMSSVSYNGGRFLVAGYQGVYTSSNASSWTKKSAGPQSNFAACVLTGDGKIVIPGGFGAMASDDGSTWPDTLSSSSSLFANLAGNGCGAFGAGVFVAVTDVGRGIFWSSDGVTWNDSGVDTLSGTLSGVAWTGNQFVAVGVATSGSSFSFTSPDGKTWTQSNSLTVPSGTLQFGAGLNGGALAYINSRLVAWGTASGKSFVSVSADGGSTWTTSTSGLGSAAELASVAYGNGAYIAVGNDANIGTKLFTSTDAKTWKAISGVAAGAKTHWSSALWGNGEFMAVGGDTVTGDGAFLTSSDGKTWKYSSTDSSTQVSDVAWDGSQYIGAANYDILRKQETAVGGGGGGGGSGGGYGGGGGGGHLGFGVLALLTGLGLVRRRSRG